MDPLLILLKHVGLTHDGAGKTVGQYTVQSSAVVNRCEALFVRDLFLPPPAVTSRDYLQLCSTVQASDFTCYTYQQVSFVKCSFYSYNYDMILSLCVSLCAAVLCCLDDNLLC